MGRSQTETPDDMRDENTNPTEAVVGRRETLKLWCIQTVVPAAGVNEGKIKYIAPKIILEL